MKNQLSQLALVAFLSLSALSANANSDPTQLGTTGIYYQFINANLTWDQANIAAQAMTFNGVAGQLAVIPNQTVNDFITNLAASNSTDSAVWLGASNVVVGQNENWTWSNGSTISCQILGSCTGGYTNFNAGEPNNYYPIFAPDSHTVYFNSETALELYSLGPDAGKWNDIGPSALAMSYVVQFPVPELNTNLMLLMGLGVFGFMARRHKNTQA